MSGRTWMSDRAEAEWKAEFHWMRDELERLDALRPPCPTCNGESIVARPPNNVIASACAPCPDCTDGRMSWERMAAIVMELIRRANLDSEWKRILDLLSVRS